MPALERVRMPSLPPNVYNILGDPVLQEDQFYPALTSCAFIAPNEAMQVLNVDARLSCRGNLGRSRKAKCASVSWKPMQNFWARTGSCQQLQLSKVLTVLNLLFMASPVLACAAGHNKFDPAIIAPAWPGLVADPMPA